MNDVDNTPHPETTSLAAGKPKPAHTLRSVLSNRIVGLVIADLTFIVVVSLLSPYFLTQKNITSLLTSMALESIALAAMTMLLIAGMFDLSVDGVVSMSGVIVGTLLNIKWPVIPAMAVAFGSGVLVGAVNGFVVNKLRVNALMATLATWWMCLGVAYGVTRAISPYGFPDSFQAIGQTMVFGVKIFNFYAIAIIAVFAVMLAKTRVGYHIYALGGNRRASALHGINVDRLGIALYITMSAVAAFVGIVMAARLNAGTPNAVDGMTLRVIAAAVIGGCALTGGRGSIIGGLLGLLLMNMLTNAAILLGVSPYWQRGIIGAVLFMAVTIDAVRGRRTGGLMLGV